MTKTVGKAVKGGAKDASEFGAGMRHVVTVRAVGGRERSSSDRITESFVSTLPKGEVAAL